MTTVSISHTTYAPDNTVFADSTHSFKRWHFTDIGAAIAARVQNGWTQTSDNQVAKVCKAGFLDVVTYGKENGR